MLAASVERFPCEKGKGFLGGMPGSFLEVIRTAWEIKMGKHGICRGREKQQRAEGTQFIAFQVFGNSTHAWSPFTPLGKGTNYSTY